MKKVQKSRKPKKPYRNTTKTVGNQRKFELNKIPNMNKIRIYTYLFKPGPKSELKQNSNLNKFT
jgi:hypothetical protein